MRSRSDGARVASAQKLPMVMAAGVGAALENGVGAVLPTPPPRPPHPWSTHDLPWFCGFGKGGECCGAGTWVCPSVSLASLSLRCLDGQLPLRQAWHAPFPGKDILMRLGGLIWHALAMLLDARTDTEGGESNGVHPPPKPERQWCGQRTRRWGWPQGPPHNTRGERGALASHDAHPGVGAPGAGLGGQRRGGGGQPSRDLCGGGGAREGPGRRGYIKIRIPALPE